ncbi:sensory box/GGDEF family protein [Vibrio cholerae]|nr:sensory box/GGDEF family protein [Vibrio cholerae]
MMRHRPEAFSINLSPQDLMSERTLQHYSNIDEIVKLEPQVIKLDGSLIRNIDQDVKQRRIAEQLVKLCQVLNAKTVAEFVHNQTVCRISEDMGVDYLQGYFLGRPSRLG